MRLTALAVATALSALPCSAQAQGLDKGSWIKGFRPVLTDMFCKNPLIQRCFKVSQQKCLEVINQTTDSCLQKFDSALPAFFQMPVDGRKWGRDVGQCAGDEFERVLIADKVKGGECGP
jgi:hypothetical protein